MTARFVYWMNVSLDLMVEHVPGEHGPDSPHWARIDEPLHQEFNDRARALSAMVQGRVVFEMMDPYWPDARTDPSMTDVEREYGEIWTAMPKILVSRTRTRTSADHNTRIFDHDAIQRLAELRRDSEGDIGVGGVNLATQLLRAHLIDELLLFTHPAILGSGRALFDALDEPVMLDLLEEKRFDNGVVMHRYAVQGAVDPAEG